MFCNHLEGKRRKFCTILHLFIAMLDVFVIIATFGFEQEYAGLSNFKQVMSPDLSLFPVAYQ